MALLAPSQVFADAAVTGDYNHQDADFYVEVSAPDYYVNMRYGPGTEYGIITPIYNGEILHVIATADNYYDGLWWGQINYGGTYGWISISQTTILDSQNQDAADPWPTYNDVSYYVMVDAPDYYCNFRTGPGISYDIITPIYNGEVLYISQECYNPADGLWWGETSYGGGSGWISLSQTSYTEAPSARPSSQNTNQGSQSPSAPEKKTSETDLVKDAYSYSGTDKSGTKYEYVIPEVDLSGSDIQKINQDIYNSMSKDILKAVSDLSTYGYMQDVESLLAASYEAYRNGDVLSLVIYRAYGGPWHDYTVYNISASGRKALSRTELLREAGCTEAEFSSLAQKAIESYFQTKGKSMTYSQADYDRSLSDSLAGDNIRASLPYLNDKGELCMAGRIYIVGSQLPYLWTQFNLKTGSVIDQNRGS